jgi:putative cell wall-binding protein
MRAPKLSIARTVGAVVATLALVVAVSGATSPLDAQAGGDRYSTAALLATEAYPDGADVALVATGENFPDALAGASLSRAYDAPILLTRRDAVPTATSQALEALGVGDVIVLGGTAAVSQEVFNSLAGGPWQVSRYAG